MRRVVNLINGWRTPFFGDESDDEDPQGHRRTSLLVAKAVLVAIATLVSLIAAAFTA